MPALPHANRLREDPYNLARGPYIAHIVIEWVVILLNIILLAMIFINVRTVLIKQNKWKTLPLLLFYILAVFSVSLRLIQGLFYYEFEYWSEACLAIQPIAKVSVGFIETWMIFEVSMRFRLIQHRYLNYAQYAWMAFVIMFFLAGAITDLVLLT